MNQSNQEHHHQHSNEIVEHLKSSIEHLQVIQKMVSDERPCLDVLNQLAGVFIRLNECRMTIVHDHIGSCLSPAIKDGQQGTLSEIEQILRQVLKGPSAGSFH